MSTGINRVTAKRQSLTETEVNEILSEIEIRLEDDKIALSQEEYDDFRHRLLAAKVVKSKHNLNRLVDNLVASIIAAHDEYQATMSNIMAELDHELEHELDRIATQSATRVRESAANNSYRR